MAAIKKLATARLFLGVAWPVACFILDPALFKTSGALSCGGPSFGPYAAYFVYPAVTLGILLLISWFWWRERWAAWGAFFAGVFWAGAGLAGLLGLSLLIFFFLAWVPGWVYLVSGWEAWKAATSTLRLRWRLLHALLGILCVPGFALLAYRLLIALFPPVILPPCPDV